MSATATEMAEEWLGNYHNENTRRAYERDIGQFLAWCEAQELEPLELRRSHGNLFLSHLLEQDAANATTHRKLAAARQFYEYLLSEEVIEKNPLQFVKFRWQRGDSETPWLNEDEMRALLATATLTNAPLRDFLLVGLLMLNGLRINELHTARIEDLAETGGVRTLWVLRKGNKRKQLSLDPRPAGVIDEYLEWLGNPSEGPLVVAITRYGKPRMPLRPMEKVAAGKRLKKLAVMARANPNVSPHALRRSFATAALGNGAPLADVQAALGHASPVTTQMYNRDKDNLDNNPTFMVCDLMFGEQRPPTAPAVATPASPAPVPLPAATPSSDKPRKRSPRRQAARPEPSQPSAQSPPAESPTVDPLDDRLEEARRYAEGRAEQRGEG